MLAMLSSSLSALPLKNTTGTSRFFCPSLFASCSVLVTVEISGRPFGGAGAANREEQVYCDKWRSIRSAASVVPCGVCCLGYVQCLRKSMVSYPLVLDHNVLSLQSLNLTRTNHLTDGMLIS